MSSRLLAQSTDSKISGYPLGPLEHEEHGEQEEPLLEEHIYDPAASLKGLHIRPTWLTSTPRHSRIRLWTVLGALGLVILVIAVVVPTSHRRGHDVVFSYEPPPLDPDLPPYTPSLYNRKALVLASYMKQNVSWIDEIGHRPDTDVQEKWEVFRYVADAPANDTDPTHLKLDNPFGREALPYLTFIIDNYNNLPDVVVFAHGHNTSWHQPTPITYKLWAMNMTAVHEEGYIDLRCSSVGCTEWTQWKPKNLAPKHEIRWWAMWQDLIEPNFGSVPKRIGMGANAQFVATKRVIRSQPLQFWSRLRDPLMKNHTEFHEWLIGEDGYSLGLFYEPLWHIVMGKGAIFCPGTDVCNERFFSNKIRCDKEPPVWGQHAGWENNTCDYHEHGGANLIGKNITRPP